MLNAAFNGPEITAMKLADFSIVVPEGVELPDGFVEMEHGQRYTLQLSNFGNRRCDANIFIDGSGVGCFRVNANSSVTLEHPVNDAGCFTFYRLGTSEAKAAEIKSSTETGLITVTFFPEIEARPMRFMPEDSHGKGTIPAPEERAAPLLDTHAAGGTGLSGRSMQKFGPMAAAITRDLAAAVTIHLRLICLKEAPRPLRPLATPIPPPLT